jgi:hypothetical protein
MPSKACPDKPARTSPKSSPFRYTARLVEVLSLCPFRAGALAWQSAPNTWSLTVVVKATFTIVAGAEATLASVQTPVVAFAGDSEAAIEDLSPLKPRVDVLVLRGRNEETASVEVSSCVLPARGPIPPYAPARRHMLQEAGLEWAAAVLRGEAASVGPAPEGFDFGFFHLAPRDQRIDLLRTGSPLVLNDVLPGQTRVETILPQRKPQAFRIHPQTGKASEIILRCDTLCIDAARNLLVLTFRGIADVGAGGPANMGTIVVAAHSAGKKIRADRIERFLRNGEPIEGESNDGRHPLERRYDTVLAAPKGDTIALPDMESAPAGVWPETHAAHGESSIIRAGGSLPFQSAPETAPAPVPPAPLNVAVGGRRRGTLVPSAEASRSADMPFQGQPPPVPEQHLPPLPPEGIFPPPPALLPIAPPPEPPPPIRPPAMLGTSFAQDEKTADLPPGHEQPEESPAGQTDKLPALVVPGVARSEMKPPAAVPSLAGKPAPTESKSPNAAPNVVKSQSPGAILAAAKASKSSGPAPTTPSAAKPITSATPKPVASAAGPKPAVSAVMPKPIAPKGPLKVPAPLGPKLKTEAPMKPGVPPPVVDKKPTAAAANKPSVAPADKPVAPAKPAPVPPMRSQAPTMLFGSMIPPGTVAATEMADPAKEAPTELAHLTPRPPLQLRGFAAAWRGGEFP